MYRSWNKPTTSMSGLKAIKAMFAITTLERHGVDTSRLQDASRDDVTDVTDAGLPTSFVLLSEDTGARTIVSSRCGLKESLLQRSDACCGGELGLDGRVCKNILMKILMNIDITLSTGCGWTEIMGTWSTNYGMILLLKLVVPTVSTLDQSGVQWTFVYRKLTEILLGL